MENGPVIGNLPLVIFHGYVDSQEVDTLQFHGVENPQFVDV